MASFIIEGGHALSGTITPQGAKNEALEVICATLLTSDAVRITNVPNILDVNNLIRLLKDIGVKVTANAPGDYTFQADELNLNYLDSVEFVKKCSALRGSVLIPDIFVQSSWHQSIAIQTAFQELIHQAAGEQIRGTDCTIGQTRFIFFNACRIINRLKSKFRITIGALQLENDIVDIFIGCCHCWRNIQVR